MNALKLCLCLALTLGALLVATPAQALTRSLARVECGIRHAAPSLPASVVRSYAIVIRRNAIEHDFCPHTETSMTRFESHFRAGTVNDHGSDYYVGLVQINAMHRKACRTRALLPSSECQSKIAELKIGTYNLRRAAIAITANRKFCRSKTKKPALFARWLSSYGGFNNSRGRRGVWCNMKRDKRGRWLDVPIPKHVKKVIAYRRELVRRCG